MSESISTTSSAEGSKAALGPSKTVALVQQLRQRLAQAVPKNLSMFLRDWHKRFGLFAFVFMGWLGFSGFLINQSASWGYDTVRIDWGWVMALYGLRPEAPPDGYPSNGHWLAITADYTLVDAKPLATQIPGVNGFVAAGVPVQFFVAGHESVIVLSAEGQKVDELTPPILPIASPRRIGLVKGHPEEIAVQDLDAFASADGGNNWTPISPADVEWSATRPMPDGEKTKLLPWSKPSVSLEHILVDAHSGRLFGDFGVYVINAVGFAAIFLAITGVWMWWRTGQRRRAAGR